MKRMSKNIDTISSNILNFRPVINFIEPETEPENPNPIPVIPPEPTGDDIRARKREVKLLADAVATLALATKKKLNLFTKDVRVNLDPKIDFAVIQALKRAFPVEAAAMALTVDAKSPDSETGTFNPNGSNPQGSGGSNAAKLKTSVPKESGFFISDDLYNRALDALRKHACNQATKQKPTTKSIDNARTQFLEDRGLDQFSGSDANTGALRADLLPNAMIIPFIDIQEKQINDLKILADWLWTNAIYKPISLIPGASYVLPKEIISLNEDERVLLSRIPSL